jgi:phytol kinase
MSDAALGAGWFGVFAAGLAACVAVRALGVPSTYVRDMLHVGAGVWILGWPWWDGATVPIAIVAGAALATAAVPILAPRLDFAERIRTAVTNGDERWAGLVHYTLAYAALTAIGLTGDPFPAAAGLLALSLGDGLGGLAGRALGRHHFRAPGAKRKSLEGTLVVALGACAGTLVAAHLFDRGAPPLLVVGLAAVAATAEALSPRGTDNLFVPLAVWLAATVATRGG